MRKIAMKCIKNCKKFCNLDNNCKHLKEDKFIYLYYNTNSEKHAKYDGIGHMAFSCMSDKYYSVKAFNGNEIENVYWWDSGSTNMINDNLDEWLVK